MIAKESLIEEMHNLSMVLDSIPILIALINAEGRIEFINRHGAELIELDRRSAHGRLSGDVLSCVHSFEGKGCGQSSDCAVCPIRNHVASTYLTGEKIEEEAVEMRLIADGQEVKRHFLLSTSLITFGDERMVLLCLTDTTMGRIVEDEKQELRKQLFQAQKLESIGRLAGGVAHDLNNLLVPILGYAEIMFEDLSVLDPRREAARQIVTAGRRANDLLRQLLAFSRKQKLSFSVFNLNDLLRNFANLLRRTLREDIAMDLQCTGVIPNINGDKGQLEQVIMNLVVNAQDAMPDGGQLTIRTEVVKLLEPETPLWESFVPGDYLLLRISDTGTGMDQETVENIFEPFFTTKPADKGTGLGLSTVHGIVVQHGGCIRVDSTPGKGTTFKILLPAVRAEADVLVDKEEQSTGSAASLLVVEDDDRMRDLLKRALERRGFNVTVCHNGESALAMLGNMLDLVDLLITDVVMPGMNGRELYERALKLKTSLKVLYMSGHTRDILSHRGVEGGTVQLIEKPFSINNLTKKIQDILGDI